MRHRFQKLVVIALGGSVIYPERIETTFIRRFAVFLRRALARGHRVVLVVGGGRLSRLFQDAAGAIAKVTNEDKDWIGIHATRLNAHLLRTVFRGVADPVVIDARKRLRRLTHPVTIAAGWKPGWSTDYVAVRLAADFGAQTVVIAGRPAYVYDKDNRVHKSARPLFALSWKEYRALIPKTWKPGAHAPVDPVAARLAEAEGIAAIVIYGKDLKNFENLLKGKDFKGTIVG